MKYFRRRLFTVSLLFFSATHLAAQELLPVVPQQTLREKSEKKAIARWQGVTKKAETNSRYFLPTGFTFPARLETAIYSYNTETPAVAVVERDIVYLRKVVIPAKTKVIGSVAVVKSHDRVLIRFHTMVFPEGDEINLTAMALALDGSAGIAGRVEKHKDSAVANTVLRSIVAGTQVALDASMVNPIAAQAAQGVSQEALQSLELARQQVSTSISVDAETGVRVYINRRIEY
ncbi:MAG: TrbI/VirB10 family protein [Elusimicrobiota bacterium]